MSESNGSNGSQTFSCCVAVGEGERVTVQVDRLRLFTEEGRSQFVAELESTLADWQQTGSVEAQAKARVMRRLLCDCFAALAWRAEKWVVAVDRMDPNRRVPKPHRTGPFFDWYAEAWEKIDPWGVRDGRWLARLEGMAARDWRPE